MDFPRNRRLLRWTTAAATVILLLGLIGCGGGGDGSSKADTGKTTQVKGPETEADAVATGEKLCKLLGGQQALSKSFKTSDPSQIAQKFSQEIYIGNFPEAAARGCLQYLKSSQPSA